MATHINLELCPVGVLNGRIIALNPLIVDELGCEKLSASNSDQECQLKCGCSPVKQLLPTPPSKRVREEHVTNVFLA